MFCGSKIKFCKDSNRDSGKDFAEKIVVDANKSVNGKSGRF